MVFQKMTKTSLSGEWMPLTCLLDADDESGPHPRLPVNSGLYNSDLSPVPKAKRDWTWVNMATVWMGMVHNVVAYETAAGLMALGMSAWQALSATFLANFVIFIALWFNAKAGTRYGVPFCVLIRSSFGPRGAQIPVILRGFIGIFWFAVMAYAGSQALDAMIGTLCPAWKTLHQSFFGMSIQGWVSVLLFWLLHAWIVGHGIGRIKNFELIAGPLVICVAMAGVVWGVHVSHGLGSIFKQPSHLSGVSGLMVYAGAVTGLIGGWSCFAVNIPDLSRFLRSDRDQMIGQLIGLPVTAVVFAAMSVIVTSATIITYGKPLWNPVDLLIAIGNPWVLLLGGATVVIATLSVNVAANILPACYDLANLFPRRLSFARASIVVLIIGLCFAPWLWYRNAASIFHILTAIGGLLGPVTGIMLADYFIVRRKHYNVADLFRYDGMYAAYKGWNIAGLMAFVLGGAAALSGLVVPFLEPAYMFSWFIGLGVSAAVYCLASR